MTLPAEDMPATFTTTELAMIRLICGQYFDTEIAQELSVSVQAVRAMRKVIMKKMKVKEPVGIVIYAVKNSIYEV